MSVPDHPPADPAGALVELYDTALPQVFGYLLPRCGSATVAEELTAETLMAAVDAAKHRRVAEVTVAWLVGIARHKLVDHWRRQERERRTQTLFGSSRPDVDDPWDEVIDAHRAHVVLAQLSPPQRLALTLRYLDALPVADVAGHLGRSLHATETLLVRARAAFRRVYQEGDDGHDT